MEEALRKIGGLVNNAALWAAFLGLLAARTETVRRNLERSNDPVEIYRLQGELRTIRFMERLREEANGQH